MRNRTLVVLDLDGTLVDLSLDTERVRESIRQDYANYGVHRSFRPLLKTLTEANATVRRDDPGAADKLWQQAWQHIGKSEEEGAKRAAAMEGVRAFLSRISHLHLVIYTNNDTNAARAALLNTGIDPELFQQIIGRNGPGSLKPSGAPISDALAAAGPTKFDRVVMVGDHPYDMLSLEQFNTGTDARIPGKDLPQRVYSIGLRGDAARNLALEQAGADFLAANLDEAADLILARPIERSLSLVLLAYNEEQTISRAIVDCRRFCQLFVGDYEIVVVDDGSGDDTVSEVEKTNEGDVRLISHSSNLGMGSSMRDGYRAATKDFAAHLPGDRQVRPQSLAGFLPHIDRDSVPLSTYAKAPSGSGRKIMSSAFRVFARLVGKLSVDFAGSYVFDRRLLEHINLPNDAASTTFLYSFQLLEELKRAGCSFHHVQIHPFPREAGASRVANVRRIVGISGEIVRHRLNLRSGR